MLLLMLLLLLLLLAVAVSPGLLQGGEVAVLHPLVDVGDQELQQERLQHASHDSYPTHRQV